MYLETGEGVLSRERLGAYTTRFTSIRDPSVFADDHADDAGVLLEFLARVYAEFAVDVADVDVNRVGRALQVLGNAMLGEALE